MKELYCNKFIMPFLSVKEQPSKEVVKGYTGRTIHTGTMTFMYWTVKEGAVMPIHSHLHEQVSHVLEGKFELSLNGNTRVLEPGIVAVIPPHVEHGGKALTNCLLLDVFHPERDDYKFS